MKHQGTQPGAGDKVGGESAVAHDQSLIDVRDPEIVGGPQSVTVVVQTKNDAANLPRILPHIPPWVDDVLIIDRGSSDGTVDVALRLVPRARVVTAPGKCKGAAVFAALDTAKGELIVVIDADGSTDPREIPAFVGALLAGADLAKGSRFIPGGRSGDMSVGRRILDRALEFGVNRLFEGRYTDLGCGYLAVRRSVLPLLISADEELTGADIGTILSIRALKNHLAITEVASFEADHTATGEVGVIRDGIRTLKLINAELFNRSAVG